MKNILNLEVEVNPHWKWILGRLTELNYQIMHLQYFITWVKLQIFCYLTYAKKARNNINN